MLAEAGTDPRRAAYHGSPDKFDPAEYARNPRSGMMHLSDDPRFARVYADPDLTGAPGDRGQIYGYELRRPFDEYPELDVDPSYERVNVLDYLQRGIPAGRVRNAFGGGEGLMTVFDPREVSPIRGFPHELKYPDAFYE